MEENLEKKLMDKKISGWLETDNEKFGNIFNFCDGYIDFLNKSKTEREFASNAKKLAEQNGFKDLNWEEKLNPGDKVYFENREKSIYFAIIGEEKLEKGLHIVGAHIDSPRLDLKPNPLYEDGEMAYFNTHYYGGIKKYQWTTIPLSIHGVIIKANGVLTYESFLFMPQLFGKDTLYFLNNGNLITIFCNYLHKIDIKRIFLSS